MDHPNFVISCSSKVGRLAQVRFLLLWYKSATKHSIGCRTPVQKSEGCNHMTVRHLARQILKLIKCLSEVHYSGLQYVRIPFDVEPSFGKLIVSYSATFVISMVVWSARAVFEKTFRMHWIVITASASFSTISNHHGQCIRRDEVDNQLEIAMKEAFCQIVESARGLPLVTSTISRRENSYLLIR